MKNVVYVLGAGFSAPLGLPVMSNFLSRSRDLHEDAPADFPHFVQVFQRISDLARVKNYYAADLFNIEEILSILLMQDHLSGEDSAHTFRQYIADVIECTTPDLLVDDKHTWVNDLDNVFGRPPWAAYGRFVASLWGLVFPPPDIRPQDGYFRPFCSSQRAPGAKYSIVTLNYDTVIERITQLVRGRYRPDGRRWLDFKTDPDADRTDEHAPAGALPLAKLHGTADNPKTICPPTWEKTLDPTTERAWRLAHQVLEKANEIRVLGYSLPDSDAYVRYLLKSAAVRAENLQRIDVICLGGDRLRHRYDKFMDFRDYRFANRDIADYLGSIAPTREPEGTWTYDRLELDHEEFMEQSS